MAIPQIASISLDSNINRAIPGVPFIHRINSVPYYYVKVVIREPTATFNSSEETNQKYISKATDYFLEHFFPEYYPLVVNINNSSYSENRQDYEDLRETIYNSISFIKKQPARPRVRIYKLSLGTNLARITPYDLRAEYETEGKLPSIEEALEFYNNERGSGTTDTSTSFEFVNYPSEIDKLKGAISSFTTALSTFQGIVPPSIDINSLGLSTNRVINKLLDVVYESIDFKHEESNFFDTDYVTMYFDDTPSDKMRIVRIEYFILNVTRSETEVATIGFITNSKYNPLFKDPLALNTLKNYKELIRSAQRTSGLTQQFPLFGTEESPGALDMLGLGGTLTGSAPLIGDIPGSLTPGNNIFGNRSSDDLIDVNNYDQLQNTFSTILTQEELRKELESAENEAVKKNILQAEKAKKLNAGIQILDNIDDVLNFNIPLAGPNKTKEQKAINQILNQFGIQALVKEAIICLTLGLGATASRITQSVRNSIVQNASSLQSEPTPPSEDLEIERPTLGEQLSVDFPFSVTGSPPIGKQIANIVLGAVANAAFEIIKSLVELIQFNCNSMLRGAGQIPIDVGDILRKENDKAALSFPNLEELLRAEFGSDGLELEQVYTYFSDVSEILDPIEVCRLLNSQTEVEQVTYDNILQYNQGYSLEQIRNNINSISAINGYFARMSQYVDTVSICNDIINNRVVRVIENCNICLDEDFFDSNPALDELINISENGIQILPPEIDFLCPDSPNYLENPIANRILPNLFDTVLDTTKIYMAGSLEAARTSLLDPTVVNEMNPDLSGALESLNIEAPAVEMDPGALSFITDMFEFFDGIEDAVVEGIEGQACADIDNAKIQNIIDNVGIVIEAIQTGLNEVPGVIEEVNDKITSIQDNNSTGGGAHVEYVFPEAFKSRFQNAIQPPTYNPIGSNGVEGAPAAGSIYETAYSGISAAQMDIRLLFSGEVGTPGAQELVLQYPKWSANSTSYLNLSYNLTAVDSSLAGNVTDLVPSQYSELPISQTYQDFNINPYIYRFLEPVLLAQGSLLDAGTIKDVVGETYSGVYGSLYLKLFNYILNNGAFSADKINNLKFFKDNDLCDPPNVGDLFDSAGILDQMKKEFAAAACYDEGSAQDKARNTLYYGLMLMLIQAIIDEFIIKNIVVFSAFKMTSLTELPLFREFMVNEIVGSFQSARLDGDSILERELYNYFQRVSVRGSTANNGGIAHTYPPYEIPAGFENDPDTQVANFPLGNNYEPLIRFLVEERLNYTWDNGQRTTLGAINKIIDPKNENKSFDDVFLEDVVGLYDFYNGPYGTISETFINYTGTDTVTFLRGNPADGLEQEELNAGKIEMVIPSTGTNGTPTKILFTINIEATSASPRFQILDAVRQDPQYQIFKNQVFNQDAIMLGAILYNTYLTELFFSDITDAFRNTKRAIINFMNMTDASTRPPVPDGPNNNFNNSLANNGQQNMDSLAREIFLKFLVETPIQILKGLVELIDPHIAISKIVKTFTGKAFTKVSQAFQTSIDAQPDESPIKAAGISGEDLLALLFCLYNIQNEVGSGALGPAATAGPEGADITDNALFGPRISLDGVDFKGTVAGMFMAPPSPLGILYLLIELLKVKIEEDQPETTNVDATDSPPSEEC